MKNLAELIEPALIEDTAFSLLGFILVSGAAFLGRSLLIRVIGGRRKREVRVLNKSRIRGSYKGRTILKRLAYLAFCLPGMLSRDRVLFAIPFLAGMALSIVDAAREKDSETAIEYERGVSYRGRFARWRKIAILGETEDYAELRIRGEELYYYKESQAAERPGSAPGLDD